MSFHVDHTSKGKNCSTRRRPRTPFETIWPGRIRRLSARLKKKKRRTLESDAEDEQSDTAFQQLAGKAKSSGKGKGKRLAHTVENGDEELEREPTARQPRGEQDEALDFF